MTMTTRPYYSAYYNPLFNEQGRVARWFATATDIEDRKRSEERVRSENLALREEIDHSSMFEEIVGSSQALRTVLSQVAKVAPADSTVLILGETGTGKELIARAIHKRSTRSTRSSKGPPILRSRSSSTRRFERSSRCGRVFRSSPRCASFKRSTIPRSSPPSARTPHAETWPIGFRSRSRALAASRGPAQWPG